MNYYYYIIIVILQTLLFLKLLGTLQTLFLPAAPVPRSEQALFPTHNGQFDSLYILILARTSKNFLTLPCWTSVTILNYFRSTVSGPKDVYQIGRPSFVS